MRNTTIMLLTLLKLEIILMHIKQQPNYLAYKPCFLSPEICDIHKLKSPSE